MKRCATCGYARETHVGTDVRCPLCACGEHANAHPAVASPPAPLMAFAESGKVQRRCPGKETQLRHGRFTVAPQIDGALYPEIMRREAVARRQAIEEARKPYEPEVIPPPLVPARRPYGPTEFAGGDGSKQGTKLGRGAVKLGWTAEPYYWRSGYGDEGCAVRLAKGPMRAVALWHRAAADVGKLTGWKAEYAYAWRVDVARMPTKLTHTELERLIQ